jgi:hypothetical protein
MKFFAITWYALMLFIAISNMFGAANKIMVSMAMGCLIFHCIVEIRDWLRLK